MKSETAILTENLQRLMQETMPIDEAMEDVEKVYKELLKSVNQVNMKINRKQIKLKAKPREIEALTNLVNKVQEKIDVILNKEVSPKEIKPVK